MGEGVDHVDPGSHDGSFCAGVEYMSTLPSDSPAGNHVIRGRRGGGVIDVDVLGGDLTYLWGYACD